MVEEARRKIEELRSQYGDDWGYHFFNNHRLLNPTSYNISRNLWAARQKSSIKEDGVTQREEATKPM